MYPRVAQFKTIEAFRDRLQELGLSLPADDAILTSAEGSPLAETLDFGGLKVGNRFCIQPMEGWDAEIDGAPSEWTLRRWRHFGLSGAKLIWGGEAAAVQEDGRANPRQTLATPANQRGLARLREATLSAHHEKFGDRGDLVIGLQLTHSGRFARPRGAQFEPRIAFHHPLLDARFGVDPGSDAPLWSDDDLARLSDRFLQAARLAHDVGYDFVDIKSCHGYLLHEFLGARVRPGRYGGDFEGRTRLLREIIEKIRLEIPSLRLGVRLSAFDSVPFAASRVDSVPFSASHDVGQPMPHAHLRPYAYGFGIDANDPTRVDLSEAIELAKSLFRWGVSAINVSGGSPYYTPHLIRPAAFPPSDGYLPPEDPLVGVARQIDAARAIKLAVPELLIVGSGYSYLQEYLPRVAQAVVRRRWVDSVGLGRLVLSYPEFPDDCLARGRLERKKICRTFSDCTSGPRLGLISGCFPLDPFYKEKPEAEELKRRKKAAAEKPAAEKPAAEKPAAEKPTAEKPTAEKPTAEKPTAEKPTDT